MLAGPQLCNTALCCQYLPLLRSIPVLVPLIHISLTASVYTTVAVAVDRAATFLPHIAKVRIGTDLKDLDRTNLRGYALIHMFGNFVFIYSLSSYARGKY